MTNESLPPTVANTPTVPHTPEAGAPLAVWFFSGDLLFASRIRSAAERAGVPFQLLGRWPENGEPAPGWIIVDLATRSGGAAEIRQRAGDAFPSAVTIAYGPHVQPQRLSQARAAGFDHVLTRGQFDAALPELFPATA